MKFPRDIEASCRKRFSNSFVEWALALGSWPLCINLSPPTEKEAMDMLPTVKNWVESWRRNSKSGQVVWREYHWRVIGKQELPFQIILANAKDVATWADELKSWDKVTTCYEHLCKIHANPSPQLVKRVHAALGDSLADFALLLEVITWLERNRNSGLYLRQLPIKGVHTKWIESNKELITRLTREIRGLSSEQDFNELLGLRSLPIMIRLRILDPDIRKQLGGMSDISVRLDELSELRIKPASVLIVENLQSGLALDDIPGTIAFLGLGNAVSVLSTVSWISQAKSYYWGDIDTYGFFILNNLRSTLPAVQSLLMDFETLKQHEAMWVREEKQFSGDQLVHLTSLEQELFQGLKLNKFGNNIRLEQERIPWDYVCSLISKGLLEAFKRD